MFDPEVLHPTRAKWLRSARIPLRMIGSTLDDLDPYEDDAAIRAAVDGWIDAVLDGRVIRATGQASCGIGLLLIGRPGAGKTRLAATIAQEIITKATNDVWRCRDIPVSPVRFITYPDLLSDAKAAMDADEDAADNVARMFGRAADSRNVRLLVLDDLGKEHRTTSKWAENFFDHLLRSRFDRGLPTIITSNVPVRDWEGIYGGPMASFAFEALEHLAIISAEGDRRR